MLLSFLGITLAFGQETFVLAPDSARGSNIIDTNEHKIKLFVNTELAELTVKWSVITMDIPEGWDITICDNLQCYGDIKVGSEFTALPIDDATPLPMEAGANGHDVPGIGRVSVLLEDVNDPTKVDTVMFIWEMKEPSSITERINDEPAYTIYPNPVQNRLNISFKNELKEKLNVKVYNLVGQEQKDIKLTQNGKDVSLDVRGLRNGTYLVQFITEEGKMTTQRFSKRQ